MKKKMLVAYYSHTGQLKEIILKFMHAWEEEFNIDFMEVTTDTYKFPISWNKMFDMMPESVLGIPCEISYPRFEYSSYDLIFLGFQPWFMHPSIPFLSFTLTDDFKALVKNKPVCIITDCRNSRRNAIKLVQDKVVENGGKIINVTVFWDDSSGNLIGAFTLLKWLFSGKKKKLFKLLPPAGVRQSIIDEASIHGKNTLSRLGKGQIGDNIQTYVYPKKEVEFTSLGYEEYIINKFRPWASYIIDNQNKRAWRLFKFQLWIIFTLVFITPFISIKNRNKSIDY